MENNCMVAHSLIVSLVFFKWFFVTFSNRLQLLTPFDKWDGKDLEDMTVLIKVIISVKTLFI